MYTTMQDSVEELAIISRLYSLTSERALLKSRLDAANAEIERQRSEIEMLKRDLATLRGERE